MFFPEMVLSTKDTTSPIVDVSVRCKGIFTESLYVPSDADDSLSASNNLQNRNKNWTPSNY